MLITAEQILDKYPQLPDLFRRGAWRKYELQDKLTITRGEVDLIISILTMEGFIKSTSIGWVWND